MNGTGACAPTPPEPVSSGTPGAAAGGHSSAVFLLSCVYHTALCPRAANGRADGGAAIEFGLAGWLG
jgi:hypothetical protein